MQGGAGAESQPRISTVTSISSSKPTFVALGGGVGEEEPREEAAVVAAAEMMEAAGGVLVVGWEWRLGVRGG